MHGYRSHRSDLPQASPVISRQRSHSQPTVQRTSLARTPNTRARARSIARASEYPALVATLRRGRRVSHRRWVAAPSALPTLYQRRWLGGARRVSGCMIPIVAPKPLAASQSARCRFFPAHPGTAWLSQTAKSVAGSNASNTAWASRRGDDDPGGTTTAPWRAQRVSRLATDPGGTGGGASTTIDTHGNAARSQSTPSTAGYGLGAILLL